MNSARWDETWHRLNLWTSGQTPSERLAAQIMLHEGFTNLDPSHPLGGPDGGKDATMSRGGLRWIMAVYFPRGPQPFSSTKKKFRLDLSGATENKAEAIAFVCNQELTLHERRELEDLARMTCEIYHLERIVAILDRPIMVSVKEQFLSIGASANEDAKTVLVHRVNTRRPPRLFGRSHDLSILSILLQSHDLSRDSPDIAVIIGMPGVGKTSLALQASLDACQNDRFPGGAILVDFNGYEDDHRSRVNARQALPSLILALGGDGVPATSGDNAIKYHDLLDGLARNERWMLLVFDNVADIGQIDGLLPAKSSHRILVTSRNSIGVRMYDRAQTMRLDPITEDDAISLIAHSSGRRSDQDVIHLRRLSLLCGSLPIALQIASHILASEPETGIEALANELEEEAVRLSGLQFEDVAVRTVFRGSYSRLPARLAEIFRHLTLHPGKSLSLTSCAHLLATSESETRRALRQLESAHLIAREVDSASWSIHDLLRLFASELTHEEDTEVDRSAALARLATHFSAAMRRFAERYSGGDLGDPAEAAPFQTPSEAIDWADREYDGAVACVSIAQRLGHLEIAWTLATNLIQYLTLRGDMSTAVTVAELAVEISRESGDLEKQAGALINLGLTLNFVHRYDEAESLFAESRQLWSKLGDKSGEARSLIGLAETMRSQGRKKSSIPVMRKAVRLYAEEKDSSGLGYALTNLATSLRESGYPEHAIDPLSRALRLHRQNGAVRAEAATISQIGLVLGEIGHYESALRHLREAYALAEAIGDIANSGITAMNTGTVYRLLGQTGEAEEEFQRALAAFASTDNITYEASALTNLVWLYNETGNLTKAESAANKLADLEARFPSLRRILNAKLGKDL